METGTRKTKKVKMIYPRKVKDVKDIGNYPLEKIRLT